MRDKCNVISQHNYSVFGNIWKNTLSLNILLNVQISSVRFRRKRKKNPNTMYITLKYNINLEGAASTNYFYINTNVAEH